MSRRYITAEPFDLAWEDVAPRRPEERFRVCACGHRLSQRYRRCNACGRIDPDWSVFEDPRVDRRGLCWIWNGPRTAAGYGRFAESYVHRLAWEEIHRACLLPGFQICHTCDNPPCLNPLHLFVGTARDNILDAVRKGLAPENELWNRWRKNLNA